MKKTIVIVLGIGVIFLAFIAFGFFNQSRLSLEALARYKKDHQAEVNASLAGVLKDKQELTQIREELEQEKSKLEAENQGLKDGSRALQEEQIKLRQELIELTKKLAEEKEKEAAASSPAAEAPSEELAQITGKIKTIAAAIDKIDLNRRDKTKLNASLRSIYDELYSLDLNISKLTTVKNEASFSGDKDVLKEFSRKDEEMKKLWERISLLEKENARFAAEGRIKTGGVKQYLDEIARLNKEKEDLSAASARYKDQLDKVSAQLSAKDNNGKNQAEKEEAARESGQLKKDLQTAGARYNQVKQRLEEVEGELAKRAEKIVNLEAALEEKSTSLLDLTVKVQDQLKELVILRENLVKSRLLNTRLARRLKEREDALAALKTEVGRIGEFNSQFKDYVERVSRAAAGAAGSPVSSQAAVQDNPPLAGGSKDKQVNVEIESVQVKQDAPGQEQPSGKKDSSAGEARGE